MSIKLTLETLSTSQGNISVSTLETPLGQLDSGDPSGVPDTRFSTGSRVINKLRFSPCMQSLQISNDFCFSFDLLSLRGIPHSSSTLTHSIFDRLHSAHNTVEKNSCNAMQPVVVVMWLRQRLPGLKINPSHYSNGPPTPTSLCDASSTFHCLIAIRGSRW